MSKTTQKVGPGEQSRPSPVSIGGESNSRPIGEWVIRIPNWTPPSQNEIRGHNGWWREEAIKKEMIGFLRTYGHESGVKFIRPDYRPKRAVCLYAYFDLGKRTIPDPDNLTKLFFDSLKRADLIVGDSDEWLLWNRPKVARVSQTRDDPHPASRTIITVSDVDPASERRWHHDRMSDADFLWLHNERLKRHLGMGMTLPSDLSEPPQLLPRKSKVRYRPA